MLGIPDKKYGEIVGAFVILKKGVELTEDDIRDYTSSRISRYKVPKHVFFVDNYPLTASGKIQKYKLRELAVEFIKKIVEVAVNSFYQHNIDFLFPLNFQRIHFLAQLQKKNKFLQIAGTSK